MREIDYDSLEVDGIDLRDYPDFCDAFICYGLTTDGDELTEQELEELSSDGIASELIIENQLYIVD